MSNFYITIEGGKQRVVSIHCTDPSNPFLLTIKPYKTNIQCVNAELCVTDNIKVPTGSKVCFGILGMVKINEDDFLISIQSVERVGSFLSHPLFRITAVECISINSTKYDMVSFDSIQNEEQKIIHPCQDLIKYMSSGSFYFSPSFDLTLNSCNRTRSQGHLFETFDDRFVWNKSILKQIIKFRAQLAEEEKRYIDSSALFVLAIQGFVEVCDLKINGEKSFLAVFSRLSSKRAGTRYNVRGIDDDGNVANFVETEVVFQHQPDQLFSFVILRGSVPGLQVGGHKIQITRSIAATQPAFDRHFEDLINQYDNVHIIDLLSQRDGNAEELLGNAYRIQTENCGMPITRTAFDFHYHMKGTSYDRLSVLLTMIEVALQQQMYSVIDLKTNELLMMQRGVMRVNCLDCLDRTNVVQTAIVKYVLDNFLSLKLIPAKFSDHPVFNDIWADNGDELSRIYTGTGALKSGFTRTGKRTIAGLMDDAKKSAQRFYVNNFTDKSKQTTIDILLGNIPNSSVFIFNPILNSIRIELDNRINEYSTYFPLSVFVATWNVNGKSPSINHESLSPWLSSESHPDLYVIGFQEIVELTPAQIMMTDPDKRLLWERQIQKSLNADGEKYTLVTSGQLVGASLCIFAKLSIIKNLRNVEVGIKKTGLKGMAGNKGGIGIRFDYYDSSFCFICAHLAAGHGNVEERNRDYMTISDGLVFKHGKKIEVHDNVIWLGDFNYRIDLGIWQTKDLISKGNLSELFRQDQLNNQLKQGNAFKGFIEGEINFNPTYKYDNGTDEYDTSEKQRIPAWTDRILFKGQNIVQQGYSRAELRLSDHKPVKSTFLIKVLLIDKEKKERLRNELRRSMNSEKSEIGKITNEISLIDFDEPVRILPLPSSKDFQWWN
ncbi:DNase I-like protein [Rozella allomycis CSF55]|uniref:phosphoinositide 5-phosphatase n=1 Tax=Rozella allomycis (strain CSF55) TaxID=988480 RepID=A0A075ASL8_ROZAC|nr:Synaptojanin domain-containing protein [Rozella allomycis CSF55]RKP21113.1 DNase I-like protein [Rozella allomycis CSF55]|eukprot:EPZ31706.1 Synaptojanin domain-containing protein [Rozella allomycis CSF55]